MAINVPRLVLTAFLITQGGCQTLPAMLQTDEPTMSKNSAFARYEYTKLPHTLLSSIEANRLVIPDIHTYQ